MEEILNRKIELLSEMYNTLQEFKEEGSFNLKLEFKIINEIARTKAYLFQLETEKTK